MSELAFDLNGDPIVLPANAEWFRVRRSRNPSKAGASEVVETEDGQPLLIAIDISFAEFRKLVDGVPGRYRLDPINDKRQIISNAAPAYVTIGEARNGGASAASTTAPAPAAPAAQVHESEAMSMAREILRANVEIARVNAEVHRNLTDRFAGIMEAAAHLITAADGVGIASRLPPVMPSNGNTVLAEDEDDNDNDDEPSPDDKLARVNALVAAIAPVFSQALEAFTGVKAPRPERNSAKPKRRPHPATRPGGENSASEDDELDDEDDDEQDVSDEAASDGDDLETTDRAASAMAAPRPTPKQLLLLLAISKHLTTAEAEVAKATASQLPPEDQVALMRALEAMTPEEGASWIRSLLPPLKDKEGAS